MKKRAATPPKLADVFFEWYCRRTSIEDLHGDITELFYQDLNDKGILRARKNYWQRVLSLTFSYAIKKRKKYSAHSRYSSTSFNTSMLKNYFLIASRNLVKHKFFTVINVVGLAVGMSCSLLLIAMLSFVWRYDTFHERKDNIYRVISSVRDKQQERETATAPPQLYDELKNISGIKEVIRIQSSLSEEAEYKNKKVNLSGYYVDPNFLNVFTFPLLKGNVANVLSKPRTMVITEAGAKKMFGSEDPIGKVISMGTLGDFEISGLMKDLPKNSHMRFEVLSSYETLLTDHAVKPISDTEDLRGSFIYVAVNNPQDAVRLSSLLNKIQPATYTLNPELKVTFELQHLLNIASGPDLRYSIGPVWDYPSLAIFMVLTLMILLPACFNYANISISRALKRTKEIGLRKVMGGHGSQIFTQFIMETVITTLIALLLSFYIFTLIRGEFLSILADKEAMALDTDLQTLALFLVFAVFVGLLAGALPAAYLSKLNPIQALKNKSMQGGYSASRLRKALLIGQFALSLGFIMSVVIVINQYRHTANYDLGFQHENILDIELQQVKPQLFRNEFLKLREVQSVSMSSGIAGTGATGISWLKHSDREDSVETFELYIDEHYIQNLNLILVAGENFNDDEASNKNHMIVNQEFIKNLGIAAPIDAIGKTFTTSTGEEISIAGVVKDFHYADLRERIKGFCFRYDTEMFRYANVKLVTTSVFKSLSDMETTWKKLDPESKFTAKFLDDELEEIYDFYISMVKICGFLGILAITISSLGLLGMVVFTVENRVKEVGVRKVMGASSGQLTLLLSRDFVKMMLLSSLVAIPVTYLFFDKVYLPLQYYHAPIGVIEIFGSLILMLTLGLTTVLSQTLKAARANPIETLRYE